MAYKTVETYVEVEVDLDEWNDEDLIDELNSRGYKVTKDSEVVEVHFDKDNPTRGYFELDWNDDFVGLLGEAGYAAGTPEEIVDLWFNDLCRSVALEAESEDRA